MSTLIKAKSNLLASKTLISPNKNIKWLSNYLLDENQLYAPPPSRRTIGVPGTSNFGVLTDTKVSKVFASVTHTPSKSVVNDIPSLELISTFVSFTNPDSDPFFDPTGNNYGTPTEIFIRSQSGYTIGSPGTLDYGAATNLDTDELIADLVHIPSASVVNDIPLTDILFSTEDPFSDSTGTDFAVNDDPFVVSTLGYTIGTPGTQDFGFATDLDTQEPLLVVTHIPSASVVNDVPLTSTLFSLDDPFSDSTASDFILNSEPFPIPEDGYTIGIAGLIDYGIATELDTNEAVIDPIHEPSQSVM